MDQIDVFFDQRIAMINLKTTEELFKGRHLEQNIIMLCVRWYLRYKLSFRDLAKCAWNLARGARGITLYTHVNSYSQVFCGLHHNNISYLNQYS